MTDKQAPDDQIVERLERGGWLSRARREAANLLRDPARLRGLLAKAASRGLVGEAADTLRTFIRLVQAWVAGRYREVGNDSILLVVAALVYVVWPLDLIPDVIPVLGLADDAGLLFIVARKLQDELNRFRIWEGEQTGDAETSDPEDAET